MNYFVQAEVCEKCFSLTDFTTVLVGKHVVGFIRLADIFVRYITLKFVSSH